VISSRRVSGGSPWTASGASFLTSDSLHATTSMIDAAPALAKHHFFKFLTKNLLSLLFWC
ncbi:MAG: hypothetical protein ACTJF3_14185, partial [Glutamicibacter arilaitensis]